MSIGNWFAAVMVFAFCVGLFALIFWRRDVTRRNAYLEIISEAAKLRDEAREFLGKAKSLAEQAVTEQQFRLCEECGQIRSRFEAEGKYCIECAAKFLEKRV